MHLEKRQQVQTRSMHALSALAAQLYVYLFLAAAAGDAQFLMELRPFSDEIKLFLPAQEEIKEEATLRSPSFKRTVLRE